LIRTEIRNAPILDKRLNKIVRSKLKGSQICQACFATRVYDQNAARIKIKSIRQVSGRVACKQPQHSFDLGFAIEPKRTITISKKGSVGCLNFPIAKF
jgi:hypothetical protein